MRTSCAQACLACLIRIYKQQRIHKDQYPSAFIEIDQSDSTFLQIVKYWSIWYMWKPWLARTRRLAFSWRVTVHILSQWEDIVTGITSPDQQPISPDMRTIKEAHHQMSQTIYTDSSHIPGRLQGGVIAAPSHTNIKGQIRISLSLGHVTSQYCTICELHRICTISAGCNAAVVLILFTRTTP